MKKVTLLITLMLCTASSYAQYIRLVAQHEMNSQELGFPKSDNPEAFGQFHLENKHSYSNEYEIRDGEALKPLQFHYVSESKPLDQLNLKQHYPYQRDRNSVTTIEVQFPESDKWFSIGHSQGTWNGLNSSNPIIYGPAKIRLKFRPEWQHLSIHNNSSSPNEQLAFSVRSGTAWAMLEVINTFDNIQAANNVTVLPQTGANLNLILESSDDLVSWTLDNTGKKPAGNRKHFYRLRAVKE
ncbi:hypothetical protein OAA59_00615 [bacterium]|nr:hypothetical protein [bacterium]